MPSKEGQNTNQNAELKLRLQVDTGIRDLLTEMKQGKSERLMRYLEFSARFHRYSVLNQMLIQQQCPNATFVAGYRKWQELGYQVAKGQTGIHILAPRFRDKQDDETEQEEKQVSYYVSVPVFDASQIADLDQKPLPVFFIPLGDNHPELAARLQQVMLEDGIRIREENLGLTQGYSAHKRVGVREGMESTNKVLTLVHEYVHELLHWNPGSKVQPRKAKECHAEAVSYVVAHHFGIHNPFSADYLQDWGNTEKDLYAELDIVRRTAAYIIQRLEE